MYGKCSCNWLLDCSNVALLVNDFVCDGGLRHILGDVLLYSVDNGYGYLTVNNGLDLCKRINISKREK